MTRSLRPAAAGLLLSLCAALLLFRIGAPPLLGPDEPRYARVAVEMHRSSDWVTPTLQGKPWLEKPALYYWLAGAAASALGETEGAMRLPAALGALVLVGASALFGARLYGAKAGLHAGFILATSALCFVYGRAASMDMLLAACVTLCIGLLALRCLDIAGPSAVTAAAAFAALGCLAKGPLGLLLPGLVVLAYAALARDARVIREAFGPWPLLAFLVVAAPWYVAIVLAQGRTFVEVFLLNHNLARFTSTVHNHPGPIWYYLPVLFAGLFPWSGLALPAAVDLRPRQSKTDLFLLIWLLLPLAFFSLAGSKLPGYILPCLPPLALLAGRTAARWTEAGSGSALATRLVALVGIALSAALAAGPALLRREGDPHWIQLVPLVAFMLLVALAVSHRIGEDAAAAFQLLRIGGAGFLTLVAIVAPPILAQRESGRDLVARAGGAEILVLGAWRTTWMSGYFYNDGRMKPLVSETELAEELATAPRLVLCGAGERRRFMASRSLAVELLGVGPRDDALLRITLR